MCVCVFVIFKQAKTATKTPKKLICIINQTITTTKPTTTLSLNHVVFIIVVTSFHCLFWFCLFCCFIFLCVFIFPFLFFFPQTSTMNVCMIERTTHRPTDRPAKLVLFVCTKQKTKQQQNKCRKQQTN